MIILVTGATAGFGLAIARRFASQGGRIIAAGRRAERLEALPKWLIAISAHPDLSRRREFREFMGLGPIEGALEAEARMAGGGGSGEGARIRHDLSPRGLHTPSLRTSARAR